MTISRFELGLKRMAKVVITLTDIESGLILQISSDIPLPKYEEHGTLAQELGLIGVELMKQEYKQVTGRALQAQTIN